MLAGKKKGDELDAHHLFATINYSSICFGLVRRIISRSWFRILINSFFLDSKVKRNSSLSSENITHKEQDENEYWRVHRDSAFDLSGHFSSKRVDSYDGKKVAAQRASTSSIKWEVKKIVNPSSFNSFRIFQTPAATLRQARLSARPEKRPAVLE